MYRRDLGGILHEILRREILARHRISCGGFRIKFIVLRERADEVHAYALVRVDDVADTQYQHPQACSSFLNL